MDAYAWTLLVPYILFVLPPWWAWFFLGPLYFILIIHGVNKVGELYEKLR